MDFDYNDTTNGLLVRVEAFMDAHVYPAESAYTEWMDDPANLWTQWPGLEKLKALARAEGLWNLFLPREYGRFSPGLTNLEYAPLAEVFGRVPWSSEIFNCSAPDTGNIEVLAKYGSPAQQEQWLTPLLEGEIRSAYVMTEPQVASSDATNIETSIVRDGDDYVINGRKWYTTGATDPRCEIIIFMGKTDPDASDRYRQQSMILVPKSTPGVTVLRPLPVFGFYGVPDRAAEVLFENVRVPAENMLLGEGRGFEIAQGRLGPGRIHHCMRLIGMCERIIERMCRRADLRTAFGTALSQQGVTLERIADARILIEQVRLLTLRAAHLMDTVGNKEAKAEIAMIKVAAPGAACTIVDWAIQLFGGGGTNGDHFLSAAYANARLLRLADGPDEVHRNQIARLEIRRQLQSDVDRTGGVGNVLGLDEVAKRFGHLHPSSDDYIW